jgi:hypothetical protein
VGDANDDETLDLFAHVMTVPWAWNRCGF